MWAPTIFCFCLLLRVAESAETKPPPSYEEYKPLVPPDVYKKLVKIYSNKTLLIVDKLKELDDVFMNLPEETLATLPTPKAFRKLNAELQAKIRTAYYSKQMGFEEKLKTLEDIMHSLPPGELKLVPLHVDVPGLIEFDVPVLLQFNGQYETNLLREYMTEEEFEVLSGILLKKNIPEVSRALLVGRLLREAYEKHPGGFPLPLGDQNDDIPDEIRRLGVHLMFSKQPFEDIDPFARALNTTKSKGSSRLGGRPGGRKSYDSRPGAPSLTFHFFERLTTYIRRFQGDEL